MSESVKNNITWMLKTFPRAVSREQQEYLDMAKKVYRKKREEEHETELRYTGKRN